MKTHNFIKTVKMIRFDESGLPVFIGGKGKAKDFREA
jgi:hypothetical protein